MDYFDKSAVAGTAGAHPFDLTLAKSLLLLSRKLSKGVVPSEDDFETIDASADRLLKLSTCLRSSSSQAQLLAQQADRDLNS